MNKIKLISALSLTLLIHNAYGMEQGQVTSDRSPLSLSRSSGEGSSTPLDKIALLKSTPLTQVEVINFDPEMTLTDGKKQFLVASLLAIDDAVTIKEGMVIVDASKTYVFPPEASEDELSAESRPTDGLTTLLQFMESNEDQSENITVLTDGQPGQPEEFAKAIYFVETVIQAVSVDDTGKVTIDVSKLPGYQEEEDEEKEQSEEGYQTLDTLTALKQAKLSNIFLVGLDSLPAEEQQAIQDQKDKIVESLRSVNDALTINEEDVIIDITKIVSYPLKKQEATEIAKTKTPKVAKQSFVSKALPLTAAFGAGVLATWFAAKHLNSHE